MSGTVRVARTQDGLAYLVDRISFGSDKVHCLGEVVEVRGLRWRHQSGGLVLQLEAVQVAEERLTEALGMELLRQGSRRLGGSIETEAQRRARRRRQRRQALAPLQRLAQGCACCSGPAAQVVDGLVLCSACVAELHA